MTEYALKQRAQSPTQAKALEILRITAERLFKPLANDPAAFKQNGFAHDFSRIPVSNAASSPATTLGSAARDATFVRTPSPYPLTTRMRQNANGNASTQAVSAPAVRDATFVKVAPTEALDKLKVIADQRAKNEFLEKSQRSLGTIINADPNSARLQANAAAIKTLRDMFGENLATLLWITRGGDQEATAWAFLDALEGVGPSAIRSRAVHPTESTR